MDHDIAYIGKTGRVALAQMQDAFVDIFAPSIVRRDAVNGTLQRPPYSRAMGHEWVHHLDGQKGSQEVFAVLIKGPGPNEDW